MNKIGLALLFALCSFGAFAQPPVDVWSVSVPSNPMNCTNTTVTVNGWNDASNYILLPITYNIVSDTIFIDIKYVSPQIILGVLTQWSHTVNLGNVPYGNYTVKARGYLDNSYLSFATGWLPVGACCPSAIPDFDLSSNTVCVGDTVTTSNSSSGSNQLNYTWWLPEDTLTSAEPVFTVNEAGTYSITLIVVGDSCSDTLSKTLEVLAPPEVDLGNDTIICDGDSVSWSLDSDNDYLWSDNSTADHNALYAPGTISVTATDDAGCVNADTFELLDVLDVVDVQLGADQQVCPEDVVMLNAGNAGASFIWSTGDTTQTITVTQPGLVSVTVSLSGSCDGTDHVLITNHNAVPVNIMLGMDSCEARDIWVSTATHTVDQWFDNSTDSVVTVTTSGVYAVTASDVNGCSSTDSTMVNVAEPPVIMLGSDSVLCGESLILNTHVAGSHQWSTGSLSSQTVVTQAGSYSVTVTNDEGCTSSHTISVEECLSVDERGQTQPIHVYPNPAEDVLSVEGASGQQVMLFNAQGQLAGMWRLAGEVGQIPLINLPSGVYVLRIEGSDSSGIRFLKQ